MPPLPKKKHSRARRGGRAAHHGIRRPILATCKDCGAARLPHRMCWACGEYRGRTYMPTEGETE